MSAQEKTPFNREALPQDIDAYAKEAAMETRELFEQRRPYPFLLYARSKLWDPKLLSEHGKEDFDSKTRLVTYEFFQGGRAFLHPIRKRQTDPKDPRVFLGRSTRQDMIVPVSSVSSGHLAFVPPDFADAEPLWKTLDLGSSNGTWVNEEKLPENVARPIRDGDPMRLGGNLIAWFLYPGHLWFLLSSPAELKKLTDL